MLIGSALVALLAAPPASAPTLDGVAVSIAQNCQFWALPGGGNLVCVKLKNAPELPEGRLHWESHPDKADPLTAEVSQLEELSGSKASAAKACKFNGRPATCRTLEVGKMVYRFAQSSRGGKVVLARCEGGKELPAFCATHFEP